MSGIRRTNAEFLLPFQHYDKALKEKQIYKDYLWMDTRYLPFQEDFHGMEVGHVFSRTFEVWNLEEKATMTVEKDRELVRFVLQMAPVLRTTSVSESVFFETRFSVVESRDGATRATVTNTCTNPSASFPLEDFSTGGVNTLKLVISICDYGDPSGIAFTCLVEHLSLGMTEKEFRDMAYLMHKRRTDGIRTGCRRRGFKFCRVELIRNALPYVERIVSKQKRFQETKEFGNPKEMGEILGSIAKGEEPAAITQWDCLRLYIIAVRYGMVGLAAECISFVECNFVESDTDFLIQILMTADYMEDKILMDIVKDCFVRDKIYVVRTEEWRRLENVLPGMAKSIIKTCEVL